MCNYVQTPIHSGFRKCFIMDSCQMSLEVREILPVRELKC